MASLILGVAGAMALGPAGFAIAPIAGISGAQIGFMVGSAIGAQLTPLPEVNGPRLSDLKVQTSTYGAMIPIYKGTARGTGMIIFSSDLIETKHEEEVGGKGGPSQTVNTYTYSVDMAVSLCANQISGVRRIWANGDLILDRRDDNTGASGTNPNIRVYLGTETQMPSSMMESYKGVGNVPAYRGQAYVEFEAFQLEKYGNRIPNLSFEVVEDGVEGLAPCANITDASYDDHIIVDGPIFGNRCWLIGNKNLDIGLLTNKLCIIDTSTGVIRDMYAYADMTSTVYIAAAFVRTIYINKMPISINEIWVNSTGIKIYVHDGYTGKLKREITKNPLSNNYKKIWFCEYLQMMVTFGAKMDFYDINTDTFQFSLDVVSTVGHRVVGNRHSKLIATICENAGSLFIYDLNSRSLVFSVNSPGFSSLAYDTKRRRFVAVSPNGDLTRFHIIDLNLNYSTVDIDLGRSSLESLVYIPSIDRFFHQGNGGLLGWRWILHPETFVKEWTSFDYCGRDPGNVFVNQANRNRLISFSADVANGTLWVMPYDTRMTSAGVPLSEVVTDICSHVGLTADDIDVSDLTDTVDGYVIGQRMSARSAIEGLQHAYFFDAVESA